MTSILLVDEQGKPSSSTIMYNDLRAVEESHKIKEVLAEDSGGKVLPVLSLDSCGS